MIGVVVSEPDSASIHIGEHLLDLADFEARDDAGRPSTDGGGTYHVLDAAGVRAGTSDASIEARVDEPVGLEVRRFGTRHLDTDGIANAFSDPSLVVFASCHAGDTGPLLTAHFTGNLGPAEFGGVDRSLARAAPLAHDRLLDRFTANAPDGYDVGTECTHHGPSHVGAPSLFAELGSANAQWQDEAAARAVARSILELAAVWNTTVASDASVVAGVGGGHYAHRFDRLRRETGWSLGHVAADWGLEDMGEPAESADVLTQVFAASGTDLALVDGDRPTLGAVIESLGYRVVSETWLRSTDGVPRDLVAAVEKRLGRVDDGVRFGARARGPSVETAASITAIETFDSVPSLEALAVRPLPDALLEGARAVDADAAWAAVEESVVAFETVEGASRAAGRAVVDDSGAFDELVRRLVTILRHRYESVEVRADAVIATETSFDPAAARDLGVSEGPAFGRLAEGQAVDVDGETIDPAEVMAQRERRFALPEW